VSTLIGMVQMFANMTDPSKLGPFMAVALLATFYGDRATWSARFSKRRHAFGQLLRRCGKAHTDPLFPDDPFIAANRRVTITLMRGGPRSRRISSPRRP
jgi:hypothetical protein